MRWAHKFPLRLRSIFRKDATEQELSEELQFHLEAQVHEYVIKGMDPAAARRTALLSLGGMERVKEECRDMRRVNLLENVLRDLRFGLRMLHRNPGFFVLAILCLTVGIGANVAVFSWIEGILFHPYPAVKQQDRLMVLAGTSRGKTGFDAVSWPDFLDFQRSCKLFDEFIAEKITGATLNTGDRSEVATGSVVSANYFDALGIRPTPGRGFEPADDTGRNAHPVVVISYQLWKDRFHSDPRIIGTTQLLNSVPHTIVGVAPKGFYGTFVGYSWQFWVPVSMQELFDPGGYKLEDRGAHWIEGFVRLKSGVTAEQAQQEISAVAKRLENDYPVTNRGRSIRLMPLSESPFNGAGMLSPTLGISLTVVLLVLLIVCANVGNLLLARSFARRHEMAVRLAVGAGRRHLLQQLVTEGLVLSAFAAAGGLLLAYWCRNGLVLLMPFRGVPLFLPGQLDWRVVTLSAGVCIFATLLFALVPAMQSSKVDLASSLKADSGSVAGTRGRTRVRSGLVLVQVSLSFVLLAGAALILRTEYHIRNASPGFSTRDVLLTYVNLTAAGYDEPRARNFQDELMARVQSLAGVQSAAYGRVAPFSLQTYSSARVSVDGYIAPPDQQPAAEYNEISAGYFSTVGIPLVAGRDFTRADDEKAAPVAIVNQAMAAQYWRHEDPVGRRLQVNGRWMQVVGVAENAKYDNILEATPPFFYVPLRQNFAPRVMLFVRTPETLATMATALSREEQALDPDLRSYAAITMATQIERSTSAQRIAGSLLGGLGALALLLAAIGMYGVMSYVVSQSTRELGLRMALGAPPSRLLRLVMTHGLTLTAVGILVGAVAALALTRLLGYLLYGVSPRDPLSFISAFALMVVASGVACFVPAWRAARTDPLSALRSC